MLRCPSTSQVQGGGEMKVGDLVELSSYGKKLKMFKQWVGDVGVIKYANPLTSFGSEMEYHIVWSKNGHHAKHQYFARKDLKYASKRNTIR